MKCSEGLRCSDVLLVRPQPGFDPRTVQPVVTRYTDWATRPYHSCTFCKYFVVKPRRMGSLGRTEMHTRIWFEYSQETDRCIRPRHRSEDNIKTNLKEIEWNLWPGFVGLMVRLGAGGLWTLKWTCGYVEMRGILEVRVTYVRAYDLHKKGSATWLWLFLCFWRGFLLSGKYHFSLQAIFLHTLWRSAKWATLIR